MTSSLCYIVLRMLTGFSSLSQVQLLDSTIYRLDVLRVEYCHFLEKICKLEEVTSEFSLKFAIHQNSHLPSKAHIFVILSLQVVQHI